MSTIPLNASSGRTNFVQRHRTWLVISTVLLAHVAIFWLLGQNRASTRSEGAPDNIIMASVVVDIPAPTAPIAQVVTPKAQPQTKPQPASQLTRQAQPSPVVSSMASSEAAAVMPAPAAPSTASPAASQSRTGTPSTAVVSLPSSDADYLNNPPPTYPRMSRRMGEQGTVVVRAYINPEGRAETAEIRTSSGYARLDDAALDTVKRWRYVPGKRAGAPEAMWFNVPIRFVLD